MTNSFPTERIAELDDWVAARRAGRVAFSECDAIGTLWARGETVRLREDDRFRLYTFAPDIADCAVDVPQWFLAAHQVANEDLYALLLDGAWDGSDVAACLARLDETEAGAPRVFVPNDPRFIVRTTADRLDVSLKEQQADLTTLQRAALDALAPRLLERAGSVPSPTSALCEIVLAASEALANLNPKAFETWLAMQPEWARVGADMWLLREHLPALPHIGRYAIVNAPQSDMRQPDVTAVRQESKPQTVHAARPIAHAVTKPQSVTWQVTLRTIHLNEGYVPVPPSARALYPHARRLAQVVMVGGLWFDNATNLTVWLDRARQRLFGDDLRSCIEFLEPGQILRITWAQSGLTFVCDDVDGQVAEEEARLVEVGAFADAQPRLESYRNSLRAILADDPAGKTFADLYKAVAARQDHKPNATTLRTVLSASPEFCVDRATHRWMLQAIPSVNLAHVAAALHRTLPLPERAATLREKMAALRTGLLP